MRDDENWIVIFNAEFFRAASAPIIAYQKGRESERRIWR